MAIIVDPPPDDNTHRPSELQVGDIVLVDLGETSLIGESRIVGALNVLVADGNGDVQWYRREVVSAYSEPDDPEEFCSVCFAGIESSEHHEKCVVPAEEQDFAIAAAFSAGYQAALPRTAEKPANVRRYIVGTWCPRGSGHFDLINDEDYDGSCGSKGWPLFIEIEDGDDVSSLPEGYFEDGDA